MLAAITAAGAAAAAPKRRTAVSIRGDSFLIDGEPTYKGRTWQGRRIEGLLMNSRMVQGIFDDSEPGNARPLEVSGYGPLGPGAQHARVRRGHARVAKARAARLHPQPAGRQSRRLLEGAALAQLGHHGNRRVPSGVHGAFGTHPRPGRRARNGGDSRHLLFRAGSARERRSRRRSRGGQHGGLGVRPRLPQRPDRGEQRVRRAGTTTRSSSPAASTS